MATIQQTYRLDEEGRMMIQPSITIIPLKNNLYSGFSLASFDSKKRKIWQLQDNVRR